MSDSRSLFSELKRRNVHKVALTYLVVAWFFFALLWATLPRDAVSPVLTIYIILATLGFILALYISWSFEATPEGLKRTSKVRSDVVLPTWSRRKYATFVIGVALLALGLTIFGSIRARTSFGTSPHGAPSTSSPSP